MKRSREDRELRDEERMLFIERLERICSEIDEAAVSYAELLRQEEYVTNEALGKWLFQWKDLHDDATALMKGGMNVAHKTPQRFLKKLSQISVMYDSVRGECDKVNDVYCKKYAPDAERIFKELLGAKPSREQASSMVRRDDVLLVTGLPWTGKSQTLAATREYAKKHEGISDEQMLNIDFDAESWYSACMTVRKLMGAELSQIAEPSFDLMPALRTYLDAQFAVGAERRYEFMRYFTDYYYIHYAEGHTIFEFDDAYSYEQYLNENKPLSFLGDMTESYEHMLVANYLYTHGIRYEYRAPYKEEISPPNSKERYKPDFCLIDYGIYIHIYACDETQMPYIKDTPPESIDAARNNYIKYRNWVRNVHAGVISDDNQYDFDDEAALDEHTAVPNMLIECYSYEMTDGILLSKLQTKLIAAGVIYSDVNLDSAWSTICTREPHFFDMLTESIAGTAEMIRSCNLSDDQVAATARLKSRFFYKQSKMNELLMNIVRPFCVEYAEKTGINDLFGLLTDTVRLLDTNRYSLNLRYVFVDNFQDITTAGIEFIKAVQRVSGAKLRLYGCRWISRGGRYGRDSSYIREFGRAFAFGRDAVLTVLYRQAYSLFRKTRRFMMKDSLTPDAMLSEMDNASRMCKGAVHLFNTVGEAVSSSVKNTSIAVVVRYESDKELIGYDFNNAQDNNIELVRADELCRMYDYVIVANCREREMGFPDSVLCTNDLSGYFTDRSVSVSYDNERSLFSLCISRARCCVFLVGDYDNLSPFADELLRMKK